jgi:hypothetical protein
LCQVELRSVPFDERGREEIANSSPGWASLRTYDRGIATICNFWGFDADRWDWCFEAKLANWWLSEADVGEVVRLAGCLFGVNFDPWLDVSNAH